MLAWSPALALSSLQRLYLRPRQECTGGRVRGAVLSSSPIWCVRPRSSHLPKHFSLSPQSRLSLEGEGREVPAPEVFLVEEVIGPGTLGSKKFFLPFRGTGLNCVSRAPI